ncbi:tRNA (adenosine(37)-N6)-dimethylallyltransferase MiaA [Myroides sp. 1354]|uniref:tRNA (adenosine(37)-N6)-dimethylallyltransferase MiaA n=1 Tax=unclassified Myroides TaxID=2642485 RepID=UPI002575DE86|nr:MULTISPECIES: tRNA (adenosine(37)-N6)-dimethylallyltransferase MiaA [unclassified Myroides]MDM1046230.1 tRNA (adenosine(37)-N6)-dimethylallyltransferase MiaA [Myroides sp. R163-1]MDM1057166.1 tRNA (adenosine(37)-N6)-dimethylallyltransferase MiaA [Myroides sp. 1354]MDM1070361.1 tRNA (adenosine(37)-N6)-dimethylallyltransferase MiaA [Myroides sp. 1372]
MSLPDNTHYLLVVIGPTAIGKTALAIQLAQHFQCEIISCDSRQFFKEMTLGTAVPSPEELAAVPHHFIQHISIQDSYSVGDFERDAIAHLDRLFEKNKVQVMVGGSGLYVNAILEGLDEFPDIDPRIREELNQTLEEKGLPYLQAQLKELDPVHYEKVALDNPQRVTRALEVSIGTGQPYSSFLAKKKVKRNFVPIVIGLEAPREMMYERINKRVDLMLQGGLLEEVKALLPYQELNALQTVGYRELFHYFNGEGTLEEAIEEIKKNTRRFAKRQITWFKRTPNATWYGYQTDPKQIIDAITKQLN